MKEQLTPGNSSPDGGKPEPEKTQRKHKEKNRRFLPRFEQAGGRTEYEI